MHVLEKSLKPAGKRCFPLRPSVDTQLLTLKMHHQADMESNIFRRVSFRTRLSYGGNKTFSITDKWNDTHSATRLQKLHQLTLFFFFFTPLRLLVDIGCPVNSWSPSLCLVSPGQDLKTVPSLWSPPRVWKLYLSTSSFQEGI